jgi:polysaccharide export outer membrane protein
MKTLRLLSLLMIVAALVSSCRTQEVLAKYIEHRNDSIPQRIAVYTEPVIKKNDQLYIRVVSEAFDEGKTDAMFNQMLRDEGSTSGAEQKGYLVDNNGQIDFPRLGTIKAEGLTKPQLADTIKKKLEPVLTNPIVIIKLQNFHITFLGEVAKAGTLNLPTERVNILEAIGLAGDISVYGKKSDILVIRENDGKVEYGQMDLTSATCFESPYFYLKQNDIVVVNPNKNKQLISEQLFYQRLGIATSITSMAALLFSIFK